MKKPRKKKSYPLMPYGDNKLLTGYNQCWDDYEKFLPSVEEIRNILSKTQVGTYQPIGIKGIPKPEPKPLFLGDYRINLGVIDKLAQAIHKRLT